MTFPAFHVYDELLDYLAEQASPQAVLAFKPSPEAEQRAELLSDKNNAGTLTPTEAFELEQLLYFDRKVTLLKARAAAR